MSTASQINIVIKYTWEINTRRKKIIFPNKIFKNVELCWDSSTIKICNDTYNSMTIKTVKRWTGQVTVSFHHNMPQQKEYSNLVCQRCHKSSPPQSFK